MSDIIPYTADKGIREFLGAIAFTLVLIGGEMMAEKEGFRFWTGAILILAAVPIYLSGAMWQAIRPYLNHSALSSLDTAANRAPWWLRGVLIVVLALIISQIFSQMKWPYSSSPSTVSGPSSNNQPAIVRPEYVRDISISPSFSADQAPLVLVGVSTITADKLRVFVDYSAHRNGWMPRIRAPIGEIKEPVKDQNVLIQLVYSGRPEGSGSNDLWWGNPSQRQAPTPPDLNYLLPAILIRVRVAIIGPSGEEQHYYFMVLRGDDEQKNRRIGILRQHELDWVADWQRSASK